MKIEPLVSIIIPLFNAEDFILKTLNSIANQTYVNYEVIIVDNASTDNSASIVNAYCSKNPKFCLLMSKFNSGGPAHPRNIGIESAKGDYIAFLDSDDVWQPNKIEKQISVMIDRGLNFTSTSSYLIDAKDRSLSQKARTESDKVLAYGLKSMLCRNSIITSSVMIHADIIEPIRFDESSLMVTVEDYHMWLTLLSKSNVRFGQLKAQLVNYRVLQNSLGHKKGPLVFAVKALYACGMHLLESNRTNLIILVLISSLFRCLKISVLSKFRKT